MSVSKWRYTEECNGRPCPGDCDHCSFEPADLISRADAIEAVKDTILKRFNLADWYEEMLNCGVEIEDKIKALPSADAVPQSEQYKKGFEDAKRAFLIEYARESENMLKRNAQLEVILNAYRAISADAVEVVRCKDCKYWHGNTEFCDIWSHLNIAQRTLADDYCSRGERR